MSTSPVDQDLLHSDGAATKQCPYCAEEIRDEAIVCRYCGRDVAAEGNAPAASKEDQSRPRGKLSRGTGILLLVVLAGGIPTLWNLAVLTGVPRPTYLWVYLGLHLVFPLCFGVFAGRLSRGAHPVRNIALGVVAAVVEAVVASVFLTRLEIDGHVLRLGSEDYVAWFGTLLLFASGAFYGDRVEARRARRLGLATEATLRAESRSGVLVRGRWVMQLAGLLVTTYSTWGKLQEEFQKNVS